MEKLYVRCALGFMELLSSPLPKLAKLLLLVSNLFSCIGEIAATQVESCIRIVACMDRLNVAKMHKVNNFISSAIESILNLEMENGISENFSLQPPYAKSYNLI